MGLCRAHRTGVQRAELRHLPAGAGPTDHRRARCHRSPADRDSRAAPWAIAEGRDLLTLPDLRSGPAAQIPGGTW